MTTLLQSEQKRKSPETQTCQFVLGALGVIEACQLHNFESAKWLKFFREWKPPRLTDQEPPKEIQGAIFKLEYRVCNTSKQVNFNTPLANAKL